MYNNSIARNTVKIERDINVLHLYVLQMYYICYFLGSKNVR